MEQRLFLPQPLLCSAASTVLGTERALTSLWLRELESEGVCHWCAGHACWVHGVLRYLDLAVDQYVEATAQLMSDHGEAKQCNPSSCS